MKHVVGESQYEAKRREALKNVCFARAQKAFITWEEYIKEVGEEMVLNWRRRNDDEYLKECHAD